MNDKTQPIMFSPTSFRLSSSVLRRLKQACLDRGLTQTDVVNAALDAWLPLSGKREPTIDPSMTTFPCRKVNLKVHADVEMLANGPFRSTITQLAARIARPKNGK